MLSFLVGAVAGAFAATYWHPQLNRIRTDGMPDLRNRLADNVQAVEQAIVDTVANLSRRAREVLRTEAAGPRYGQRQTPEPGRITSTDRMTGGGSESD